MKFYILGIEGQIGSIVDRKLKEGHMEQVQDAAAADVLVLAVNSTLAKDYIDIYTNKLILNFSSYKPNLDNVINGIGCSTLSVLLALYQIKKELVYTLGDINVVTLMPQSSLSSKSKNKGLEFNKSIHTYEHNHQKELETIFKKRINMSHIITPAPKYILSNITIKFTLKLDLHEKIKGCKLTTRDGYTWNIIVSIDNLEEPVNYILKLLETKGEELCNQLQ